jgi:hypothetical protein
MFSRASHVFVSSQMQSHPFQGGAALRKDAPRGTLGGLYGRLRSCEGSERRCSFGNAPGYRTAPSASFGDAAPWRNERAVPGGRIHGDDADRSKASVAVSGQGTHLAPAEHMGEEDGGMMMRERCAKEAFACPALKPVPSKPSACWWLAGGFSGPFSLSPPPLSRPANSWLHHTALLPCSTLPTATPASGASVWMIMVLGPLIRGPDGARKVL